MKVKGMKHGLYEIYWTSGGSSLAAVGSDSRGYNWLAPCNWINGSWMSWESVKSVKIIVPHEHTKKTKSVKSDHPKQDFNSDNFNIVYDENS